MNTHVYTVHGLILKRRNVGEADRIITIFTLEFGKMRVIAKGVRKLTSRRASHLEVFRHATITLRKGKTIDYVSEVTSAPLLPLATSITKMSLAYYICELVDRLLPEHQEQRDVFALILQTFKAMYVGEDTNASQKEVFFFALELLWCLGYLPRTTTLQEDAIQNYIEGIIEKKLRAPALLTKLLVKE